MKMIYKTTSGEEIRFDDFHKSTDNSENPWAAICPGCRAKYVNELEEASVSRCPASSEICGVEGCNNEVDFYVDFQKEQVEFTTSVSVTLEKSISVTQEFEATPEEVKMLKNGENPFFHKMSDICNEECGEVEYDFAATDEDTGKVLVEWG